MIRAFQPTDAEAVRRLFIRVNRELAPPDQRAAFETYIEASLHDEIDRIDDYYRSDNGGEFWVVCRGDALAGMFGIERLVPRRAELRRMYVTPEFRRQGLAKRMLVHAERYCRDAGFEELVLSTSEVQEAALAFYRAAGYRQTHEERAETRSNKTVGSSIRRFHFVKPLKPSLPDTVRAAAPAALRASGRKPSGAS